MHLDRAHPDFAAAGQHAQFLTGPHLGAKRGAGDDRAVALDYEGAVHRQAEQPGCAARLKAAELRGDLRP